MPIRRPTLPSEFGLLSGQRPRANRLILIGDADARFSQRIWQQGLERDPPIEIASATSGPALVDRLNALTPMALAINVELPGFNVPRLIQTIANHPIAKHMPIIGLTDKAPEELLVACQMAGTSHILQKPFGLELIVKACREALAVKKVAPAQGL